MWGGDAPYRRVPAYARKKVVRLLHPQEKQSYEAGFASQGVVGHMEKARGAKRVARARPTGWRSGSPAGPHRYVLMLAYWFAVVATLLFSTLYGWHSWQRYKESGIDRLTLTTTLIAATDRGDQGGADLGRRPEARARLARGHHLLEALVARTA